MSEKDYWFIPKRANVHQMLALLKAIIDRNYHGKSWNPNKQDNLNLSISRLGATRSGNKIANQGMRTLLASAQYLGFVYLDNRSSPTTIKITEAGYHFYNKHKDDLVPMPKLKKNLTVNKSPLFLFQMSKLQITNPVILPFSKNILVFPFRATLEILKELIYLDKEELALYVFGIQDMSEISLKIEEIKQFRKLDNDSRIKLVDIFKKTSKGNITLVQAPSSGYFMQFCEGTGIIDKVKRTSSDGNKISAISIKKGYVDFVDEVLDFYNETDPYDFEQNLDLWIDYIGDPNRLHTPYSIELTNSSKTQIFFEVFDKDDNIIDTDVLDGESTTSLTVFHNEYYKIKTFDYEDNTLIYLKEFLAEKDFSYDISYNIKSPIEVTYKYMKRSQIIDEIISHSNSRSFNSKMLTKLKILNKRTGLNKQDSKNLRGGFYEYLFNLFLNRLKDDDIIDEIIWNGKLGKYNLPVPAPGGKQGTPDIIFMIDNTHYVLELTTIKSKNGQEKAEGFSVPDHIKLYNNKMPATFDIKGIFCAPLIHDRGINGMRAVLSPESIDLIGITDADLLKALDVSTRKELTDNLNSLFESI